MASLLVPSLLERGRREVLHALCQQQTSASPGSNLQFGEK